MRRSARHSVLGKRGGNGTNGKIFRELAHGLTDRIFENDRWGRDFRDGSTEVAAIANHVCFTPNNRHLRLERTLPFRANFGSDGTTP